VLSPVCVVVVPVRDGGWIFGPLAVQAGPCLGGDVVIEFLSYVSGGDEVVSGGHTWV
jgi:hypothetical protein